MNQDNLGVFNNSFSLGKNWADTPEESSKRYSDNFARIQRFLKKILDTPELELVDVEVFISITTKEVQVEEKQLNDDFWLSVANGEFNE